MRYIFLTGSDWGDSAVSNMQLAAELSVNYNVDYFQTFGRRWPKLKDAPRVINRINQLLFSSENKKYISGLNPKNVNIHTLKALPFSRHQKINKIAAISYAAQIRRVISDDDLYTVIVYNPIWYHTIACLKPNLVIYHLVDKLETYQKDDEFLHSHNSLLKISDKIITPSNAIKSTLGLHKEKTFLLRHGVKDQFIRGDLKIPSKRDGIIYSGTLANWLDYDLLLGIARAFPQTKLHLVGYVHALTAQSNIDALRSLENVVFHGYKNYDELPRLYSKVNVGIVPYDPDNEHIKYSSPTKFYDYLSCGLNVVSTKFAGSTDFKRYVSIAETQEEFITLVQSALKASINNSARDFISENTWAQQAKRMVDIINE